MKILEVISYFTPQRGGDVNICYNLSNELSKRGHSVTIATTDFEFDPEFARSLKNVNVIPFKAVANLGLFLYSPAMKAWLRSNVANYDVIHLHNYRSYPNTIVWKSAKKAGVPVILQPHGSLARVIEKQGLKQLYDLVWGHTIIQASERVVVLTSLEADQAMMMGARADQLRIIANGIDLSQFDDTPPSGTFRSRNAISSDAHLILFLGRLHPIKGVDLLIRAFALISTKITNCVLVIAGPDGGALADLEEIVQELGLRESVLFTGPLYGNEKYAAYNDADIYVLPSRYETFPMTVLEAWAFRKPVIVTENCGIQDLVGRGSGIVVQPDPLGIASAMITYLLQDSLRRSHGESGYCMVHDDLSLQTMVNLIENQYRDVTVTKG